jgi:hypothetical protein
VKKGQNTSVPSGKGSAVDELEGAASHRSFQGARAPRINKRARTDPMADDGKGREVVRPSKGELSPRD